MNHSTRPGSTAVHVWRRLLALALASSIATLAPAAHAKLFGEAIDKATGKESAEKVEPYDFAAGATAQAGEYVDVARGAKFKEIKKVGIVNFAVEFALGKKARSPDGGLTIEKNLPAPDTAELQAIVDRLYRQVQDGFKALGIEVVPFETLQATKNFQQLAPAQHASPWVTDTKDAQSVLVAPSGMPLYFDNVGRADFMKGLGIGFGTNTRMKEVMMVYDLKQEVHLVSINMVVDFATVKTSGGNVFSGSLADYDIHHLQGQNSSFRFVSNTQPEFVVAKLKKTIVSDKPLWTGLEDTKTREVGMTSVTKSTATTGEFNMPLYYQRSEEMMSEATKMFFIGLAAGGN
jgi:hypothetical protein